MTTIKQCTHCKRTKLTAIGFSKDRSMKDGFQCWCKECRKEWTKQHYSLGERKDEVFYYRKRNLKVKYHITLEQYNEILEGQNGVCAICGQSEIRKNQYGTLQLCVDHDHETKKIRGLLCSCCNSAIGYFHDDVDLLENAVRYLRSFK